MESTETLTRAETAAILGEIIARAMLGEIPQLSPTELDGLKVAFDYLDIPSITAAAYTCADEPGRIVVKLE